MEIMGSGEPFLQWDKNLSELSEPGENDILYSTHFTELLDDLSQEALLGQLLSDPFLSGRGDAMDTEEDLTPASPVPPRIQAEHSYSLCGDSRPQSPLSHQPGEPDNDEWLMEQDDKGLKMESLLCDPLPVMLPTLTLTLTPEGPASADFCSYLQVKEDSESLSPQIKLEPHEVDQFLNLSPKGLESLQMPPTPPSSHGSDSEGSQSPTQTPARAPSSLSSSPLLTAPHKLQGSGPLLLTEEEKRTLIAEGYPVPTKLPLSKAEEKALKKIRRKIKNKISAQESRRKKKEYMDALEKKVETCSNENSELRRKVETLECTNKSLLQQLHSLQAAVAGKVPRSCRVTGTQTSTCLMVVVLCFSVFLGSFYQGLSPCSSITKTDLSREISIQDSYTTTVRSRNLLSLPEHGGLDEPHPVGLGGDYPEWDHQVEVMAAWRLEQQHKQEQAELREAEPRPLILNTNETRAQKAILIDLHSHRSDQWSNETAKVIQLERTVNETS
uniref:Cyclic AMP-responsive element-binding protein 3-like protein 2 n=1 Tax=Sinocyclocheilus rhinocerous TaxID=307959 RepID=A0A673FR30_9TELE